MDRLLILLAVIVVTGLFSAWWRARDGRVNAVIDDDCPHAWDCLPIEAADLVAAVQPTTELVLVEFTAPDCAPCDTTKRILEDETAGRPTVSIAQIDVADALDLARAHRIMRAPTTLLITSKGHLLGRVSGVPRVDELRELLDASSADRGVIAA